MPHIQGDDASRQSLTLGSNCRRRSLTKASTNGVVQSFSVPFVPRQGAVPGRTDTAHAPVRRFFCRAPWLLHVAIVSYYTVVATTWNGGRLPASSKYVAPWIILPLRNNVSVKSADAVNPREPEKRDFGSCYVIHMHRYTKLPQSWTWAYSVSPRTIVVASTLSTKTYKNIVIIFSTSSITRSLVCF